MCKNVFQFCQFKLISLLVRGWLLPHALSNIYTKTKYTIIYRLMIIMKSSVWFLHKHITLYTIDTNHDTRHPRLQKQLFTIIRYFSIPSHLYSLKKNLLRRKDVIVSSILLGNCNIIKGISGVLHYTGSIFA